MGGTTEALRRVGRWLMNGPRRRRLYDTINSAGKVALGSRIRSGPAAGLRFQGGDTVGYLLGLSEPAVQQVLVDELRPGGTYLDIGTHAGFLALLGCRLVGPSGAVHCFEPVPSNIAVLRRNLDDNDFRNAVVHELALADFDGEVQMDVGSRAITASINQKNGSLHVPAARLDSLGLPAPSVVKIDVEGAEVMVLRGMSMTLERARPTVIVEIHGDTETAVREVFDAAGYLTIERIDDGGMPHLVARSVMPLPGSA